MIECAEKAGQIIPGKVRNLNIVSLLSTCALSVSAGGASSVTQPPSLCLSGLSAHPHVYNTMECAPSCTDDPGGTDIGQHGHRAGVHRRRQGLSPSDANQASVCLT